MSDPRTIAVYDAKAGEYAKLVMNSRPNMDLQTFIDLIPAAGRVLDLGCGPATASAHMRAAGLDPVPVDASGAMVALANETYGIKARQASFDDLDAVGAYAGVWANFSLLHAPRADLPRHLGAIHRALIPGGVFHIGMKTGAGEARDLIDRLYTYVGVAELQELLTTAGFQLLATREGVDTGLSGSIDPFVICLTRKPDA